MGKSAEHKVGFYKVRCGDGWTVMHFDGKEWLDYISGQYAECDNSELILEVGEMIDPAEPKSETYKSENGDNCSAIPVKEYLSNS